MLKIATNEAQVFPHRFPDPRYIAQHRGPIEKNRSRQPVEVVKHDVNAIHVRSR